MKKYRGVIQMTYTQMMEVDAGSELEARLFMIECFDPTRCFNTAEADFLEFQEIKPPKKRTNPLVCPNQKT